MLIQANLFPCLLARRIHYVTCHSLNAHNCWCFRDIYLKFSDWIRFWNCNKMALSFYAVWRFKKCAFFWRPSWIYANCKNCPKLIACHSSQIGSMTPVNDRETKNSKALNISRSKLKPFSSVIWTRKQRFLAKWGCLCLNNAYMSTLRAISSVFALINYQYNKCHKY